jgi:hypothetical protein
MEKPSMATVIQMIEAAEQRKLAYERAISDAKAAMKQLGDLQDTGETRAEYRTLMAEQRIAVDGIRGIDYELKQLRAAKAEDDEADRLGTIRRDSGAPMPRQRASFSVSRNERVYRPDTDPHGEQFLLDVCRSAAFGDPNANERLVRHTQEERVERGNYVERAAGDLITSGLGGLVVPQYLVEMYAPAIAAMRPFANLANHHLLPESGMSLIVPKISTASSAALQATQLTGVSATSVVETDLTLTVQTAAGQQNISRQAVERGTGIDDMVAADLFKRVATVIDSTMLNQAATGITNVAQVVTYTDAAPTGTAMYPYIFQASSKLEQALLTQAPVNAVVMHPRRWNWLASQVSTSWPLMGAMNAPVPPQMTMVQVTQEYGPSVRGVLTNGLRVCVDANVLTNGGVGTNQDEIYVCAMDEIHLWEAPNAPVLIRAEQPNVANLGILLVAYSYFAFSAQRYSNNPSAIKGTGLVAPSGF